MDPKTRTWQRLLHYREELVEICDLVAVELSQNRRQREQWHNRTLLWKKIWMSDRPKKKNADGNAGP